ncbi:MAG: ABC transporter substrate-binding protein [Rhodobacteraceae bacterium]|jgi:ABC-type nitrate/sulfonate/bicarbonate transport system substrate-binding protein|nr:ABC transporter substrate-binding protein [Paracoccaceae bacterium]
MTRPLRLIAALALTAAPVSALAQDVSLRLPWILNVQGAGYVMAKEKGFYEEAGLNVEIMPGGPNLNSTALVATGANTFGTNDTNGVILGISQGMDLVMVGACFQRHPAGVIALASSGIDEPADLVGKRLAYTEGGPWTLTQAMLRAAGVDVGQIELVVSPSTELLINGDVDAKTGFTVNEPIAVELAGHPTSIILPSDFGIESNAEVIFTTRTFLQENPETVRAFLAATIRGYEYAYANQAETVAVVTALNNQLDPAQQTEQIRRQEGYIFTDFAQQNGVCAINPDAVAGTLEMLNTVGGMSIDLDPATLFTTDYLP